MAAQSRVYNHPPEPHGRGTRGSVGLKKAQADERLSAPSLDLHAGGQRAGMSPPAAPPASHWTTAAALRSRGRAWVPVFSDSTATGKKSKLHPGAPQFLHHTLRRKGGPPLALEKRSLARGTGKDAMSGSRELQAQLASPRAEPQPLQIPPPGAATPSGCPRPGLRVQGDSRGSQLHLSGQTRQGLASQPRPLHLL